MNQNFNAVSDEMLENVAGGYLQVSKWRDFSSTQVMPVLNGLMRSASENDKVIINQVCGILQATTIPGADVAQPVKSLWINYNNSLRPRLQSENVKTAMDQALYSAKMYIDQNA